MIAKVSPGQKLRIPAEAYNAFADAANAQQARSQTQVERFKRLTGYPQGRPGWVVDHMVPLACGV